MEHWNEERLNDSSSEKKMFRLRDIFKEVWEEKNKEANLYGKEDSNSTDGDTNKKNEKNEKNDEQSAYGSLYRKKLNDMFQALFGCGYNDILITDQAGYQVGENGKILIKFLLKNYSRDIGKKLRKKKKSYKDIDFMEENKLLFYIAEFLKEWKEQGGEEKGGEKQKVTTEYLTKKILEKFDISDDTFKLRKAISEFNQWMEILVNDNEMIPVHRSCAERIGNWMSECDKKIKYFDSNYVLLQLEQKDMIILNEKIGSISKHNLLANEIDYFGGHMYDDIESE